MPKLPVNVSKTLTDTARALEKRDKKKKEEALIQKVKRKLQQIYYGKEYYSKIVKPKSVVKSTVRTKAITRGLKVAGLTQKEINRLRGIK